MQDSYNFPPGSFNVVMADVYQKHFVPVNLSAQMNRLTESGRVISFCNPPAMKYAHQVWEHKHVT